MAAVSDLNSLEERYLDSCRRYGVGPNEAVLSAFFKAKVKKSCLQLCSLVLFINEFKDVDFLPLLDVFKEIDSSEVDAVDILQELPCTMEADYVFSLLHSISQKLHTVDLIDLSFGKDFLRDLSQRGLSCRVLNLTSSHFRKLNMTGQFMQLRRLNLDYSSSLTSLRENCFSCMPNLKSLSLRETRIANLWTTSAAISKLPSLVELRFQNCKYCDDTASSGKGKNCSNMQVDSVYNGVPSFHESNYLNSSREDVYGSFLYLDEVVDDEDDIDIEDSSDDGELDFWKRGRNLLNLPSDVTPGFNWRLDMHDEEIYRGTFDMEDEESPSTSANSEHIAPGTLRKYIFKHSSPICYEKHYREYMIASLPKLKFLDDLDIQEIDRESANIIYSEHFELLPYKRNKENVVNVLKKREFRANRTHLESWTQKVSNVSGKSQYFYSRSLCAAKVGSSPWPLLHPLSISCLISGEKSRSFRPRQFEYHPTDSSLMVFGTLDGEVVIINHENGNSVCYIPSLGSMNCVLGLCWLRKYPSKLIAGSDNGSLKLYDIQHLSSRSNDTHCSSWPVTFDEFDQLTSVHVNSTDELFLASGYSKHVALYDIGSGRRLNVFTDMHREHINVVKFANNCPNIFATSSFDRDIKMWDLRQKPIRPCYTASSSQGNVMVCFSPDDHYILASAVDNEVKQLLAVDGRLHLDFDLPSTGSSQNYTRSYYMNGRDYIISGSCDEHVVRICCAQTGRRLRDVLLEGKGSEASMFVQSLRGDPFREFNMSILAAYIRPDSNSEIVKVNLLASNYNTKKCSGRSHSRRLYSMGG